MVLFGKELREGLRTYRFWVLLGVFIFFGLLSPLSAKFLPEILASALPSGVTLEIPPPTFIDSFAEFFSSLSQMGALAMILVFMGAVSEERARGTAVLVMVRPVSRTSFVLAKSATAWLMMILAVVISTAGAALYTFVLFTDVELGGFLLAVVGWIALFITLISFTVLFSVIFSSSALGGLASFGVYILLLIIPVFGYGLDQFTPGAVSGVGTQIMLGEASPDAMIWPVVASLLLAAAAIAAAVTIFKRQEL